jgi:hypothetical protein
VLLGVTAALLLSAGTAHAEDKEPSAVLALGAAAEWSQPGWLASVGPKVGLEFPVIKDWLEIEISGSSLFRRGQTEFGTGILFRKPFTLSDKVEFMIGVGPAFSYTAREGSKAAGEISLDFMFWPTGEKKYGWFIEPSYSYSFMRGHERSLGVNVGLLVGIP